MRTSVPRSGSLCTSMVPSWARTTLRAVGSPSPLPVFFVVWNGSKTLLSMSGATESHQSVPLQAGVPAEVALSNLAPGRHTVRVDSHDRVVAAVWSTTGFAAGSDFGWYPAAPEVSASTLVTVPDGPSTVLSIVNTGTKPAVVKLAPVDGTSARSLTIPAGQTLDVSVAARSSFTLDPQNGAHVRAAVTLTGAGALADIPVWPGAAAAASIDVYSG